MCKGCLIDSSGDLVLAYLTNYSGHFEASTHELALAIKGIKYLKTKTTGEKRQHLHQHLKRLQAVARELNQIRGEL